jgi:hypothetical protein
MTISLACRRACKQLVPTRIVSVNLDRHTIAQSARRAFGLLPDLSDREGIPRAP